MPKPCEPMHPTPVDGCPICWRAAHSPKHQRIWGLVEGGKATTSPRTAPTPCAALGDPTGDTVTCPTCSGRVELKVFACSVFGVCTPGKKVDGVACCKGCVQRA